MTYFVPMHKDIIKNVPTGLGFKCAGEYFDELSEAQEYLEARIEKEEFLAQQEFEEKLMKKMFSSPPPEVQLGGKKELIEHIAKMAVELYEKDEDGLLRLK